MPPETPPHVVRRDGLALAYAIGLVVSAQQHGRGMADGEGLRD